MRALEVLRNGRRALAARIYGDDPRHPTLTADERKSVPHRAELMALPQRTVSSPQILDPDDPDFGKFKWIDGFDDLDDGIS